MIVMLGANFYIKNNSSLTCHIETPHGLLHKSLKQLQSLRVVLFPLILAATKKIHLFLSTQVCFLFFFLTLRAKEIRNSGIMKCVTNTSSFYLIFKMEGRSLVILGTGHCFLHRNTKDSHKSYTPEVTNAATCGCTNIKNQQRPRCQLNIRLYFELRLALKYFHF